jgi:hypothetical protein
MLCAFGCKSGGGSVQEEAKLLRLILPVDWELNVGDSRSIDYVFDSSVTDRNLTWTVFPESVASIDKWGRVTAKTAGNAIVAANTADKSCVATAVLHVVTNATNKGAEIRTVNYSSAAASYGDNLQKRVTRYAKGSADVPATISGISDFTDYQTVTTADNAIWTITNYGVLRNFTDATYERDVEQRFMGDRYFYEKDTTDGAVQGIVADGSNGIWTIMATGYTHIEMIELSGQDKARTLWLDTKNYVDRRGMVSQAILKGDEWVPDETDNDGLWTAMYGAGELMRYGTLKNSGTATAEELEEARISATRATEAVLLLSNISARTGTTEAYVHYQPNIGQNEIPDWRWLSPNCLEKDGDASLNLPDVSPADAFTAAYEAYIAYVTRDKSQDEEGQEFYLPYILDDEYMEPITSDDWSDPRSAEEGQEYEKRTRNLEGYVARTYSLHEEGNSIDGYVYWEFADDGKTATGVSTKGVNDSGYYLNGENLRGVTVDASGDIPDRLWNDLIGEEYTRADIVYKGDTSSDELIGHLFIYKLAFDILGPEDEELKQIIVNTLSRLSQHIVDNGYQMIDGAGQPGTWSKFNREFFYNRAQLGGAPLTAAVILSLLKLTAYVTGDIKWENEYRMAALDPAYEYAELMTQYIEQCELYMLLVVDETVMPGFSMALGLTESPEKVEMLTRMFLNYSDEEMAMLAFYLLFQMETDETLLTFYRAAIDDWWESMKYSENPLWYYIYQLAYPNETKTDAYGNKLVDTAAWALSRHPLDTRRWCASNDNRDDVALFSLKELLGGHALSYKLGEDGEKLEFTGGSIADLITSADELLTKGPALEWYVAAADERSMHKYNCSSYDLSDDYNPNMMEGSTTYTLPYWMGRYHGMLVD